MNWGIVDARCVIRFLFGAGVQPCRLMNLFHDGIPMRIVRQGPSCAQNAFRPFPAWCNDFHLYLNLLPTSYTQVFIKLNSLTADDSVHCLHHVSFLRFCHVIGFATPSRL